MSQRPGPPRFVTLPEIRRAARERLPREAWNFGDGGAETETTLRRNRRHLDRLAIEQNVLVDVREIDLRTSLLGVPLSSPVSVAPMGGLILFHPEGDVEMARGAAQADTLQWLSGATGWPVEEVAKAGKAPQMFQLYHHGDRGWVSELLSRVEASGYQAVALTVDVQLYGRRERDVLARFSPRKAMEIAPNPRGPNPEYQARLTWADVEWLMNTTKLPVGLKGIMTVRDARRAVDMGVRLIWVSNHRGRSRRDRGRRRLLARHRRGEGIGARGEDGGDRADSPVGPRRRRRRRRRPRLRDPARGGPDDDRPLRPHPDRRPHARPDLQGRLKASGTIFGIDGGARRAV